MFTHTYLGTNKLEVSRRFYDAVMATLGYSAVAFGDAFAFPSATGALVIGKPKNGEPATASNGYTLGLSAKSAADVDAFHAAGIANGGTCEGLPGIRPNSPGEMYGAYLRDPDGNKICSFAPNPNAGQ